MMRRVGRIRNAVVIIWITVGLLVLSVAAIAVAVTARSEAFAFTALALVMAGVAGVFALGAAGRRRGGTGARVLSARDACAWWSHNPVLLMTLNMRGSGRVGAPMPGEARQPGGILPRLRTALSLCPSLPERS